MFSRLKAFDVYRKLPQDLTEPTMSGAIGKTSDRGLIVLSQSCECNHYGYPFFDGVQRILKSSNRFRNVYWHQQRRRKSNWE
jgi:hypothetical protein